jgi:outer membrane murein-binding lipoprotein Lpp
MRIGAAIALSALVAGCASKSNEISPSYVSPIMYQNHNCQQLAAEAQGVSARAAQVSGAQDSKRTNDQIATGVAIVVFWPAAFLVGGDGPMAAELANLKGQMVAIEHASIQKQCGISFQRTAEGAGPAPAYVQAAPPPAVPPPITKQAKGVASSKAAKQTRNAPPPPPVAPAISYAPSAPPEPQLSEADRAMNSRN